MEQLVYNNEVVAAHSFYPLCHSFLNTVSNKDYPGRDYFNPEIECLDMDFYEKNVLHKAQADHTVDAVIGVQTYEKNQGTNVRLLLVELRMGYESAKRLSKEEIEGKSAHTKALLSGEKAIHRISFFVFTKKVAPLARNWFERQQRTGGEIKNCQSCAVSEFNEMVKSIADFPYVPLYSTPTIKDSLKLADTGCMNYMNQVKFWCEQARNFQYKNPQEYTHIKQILTQEWADFRNRHPNLTDDEELMAEIMEEDFVFLSHQT